MIGLRRSLTSMIVLVFVFCFSIPVYSQSVDDFSSSKRSQNVQLHYVDDIVNGDFLLSSASTSDETCTITNAWLGITSLDNPIESYPDIDAAYLQTTTSYWERREQQPTSFSGDTVYRISSSSYLYNQQIRINGGYIPENVTYAGMQVVVRGTATSSIFNPTKLEVGYYDGTTGLTTWEEIARNAAGVWEVKQKPIDNLDAFRGKTLSFIVKATFEDDADNDDEFYEIDEAGIFVCVPTHEIVHPIDPEIIEDEEEIISRIDGVQASLVSSAIVVHHATSALTGELAKEGALLSLEEQVKRGYSSSQMSGRWFHALYDKRPHYHTGLHVTTNVTEAWRMALRTAERRVINEQELDALIRSLRIKLNTVPDGSEKLYLQQQIYDLEAKLAKFRSLTPAQREALRTPMKLSHVVSRDLITRQTPNSSTWIVKSGELRFSTLRMVSFVKGTPRNVALRAVRYLIYNGAPSNVEVFIGSERVYVQGWSKYYTTVQRYATSIYSVGGAWFANTFILGRAVTVAAAEVVWPSLVTVPVLGLGDATYDMYTWMNMPEWETSMDMRQYLLSQNLLVDAMTGMELLENRQGIIDNNYRPLVFKIPEHDIPYMDTYGEMRKLTHPAVESFMNFRVEGIYQEDGQNWLEISKEDTSVRLYFTKLNDDSDLGGTVTYTVPHVYSSPEHPDVGLLLMTFEMDLVSYDHSSGQATIITTWRETASPDEVEMCPGWDPSQPSSKQCGDFGVFLPVLQ